MGKKDQQEKNEQKALPMREVDLEPILKNTSGKISSLPRIPSSFWKEGWFLFEIFNYFWQRNTNSHVPKMGKKIKTERDIKTFQNKTHPGYVIKANTMSVQICFCTSQKGEVGTRYIPKGIKLDETGYVMDRNVYLVEDNGVVNLTRGFRFTKIPAYAGKCSQDRLKVVEDN